MSNEFHTLNGTCSNLVSSGTRHANVSLTNQVCGAVCSISSQSTMDGNRFIAISYDYSYSNIWQNFGIIIGFGIAFLTALLVFAKYNRSLSGGTSAMLFKQEAKAPVVREAHGKADTVDEEKGVPESRDATEKICGESGLRSSWTSLFP
ncbi:CDR ABC transporter-domain-containing protein [Lactarius deliciosus]|nr:CDR ABC transporter-domain-containing protein [Lactarius deliciosus]